MYTDQLNLSSKILELLYSEDIKENIQTKIEEFLLTNQTNLMLNNKLENKNIDFTILRSDLTKVLLESKADLFKLYTNYLAQLENGLVEDSNYDVIFKVVDFDYICNILYGRLLRILSNNNRVNVHTILTGISYDLGKDLINRYNFLVYSQNKSNFNRFSLFKSTHKDLILEPNDPEFVTKDVRCLFIILVHRTKIITNNRQNSK